MDLSKKALPEEQQIIRAKCFHPSGAFIEFTKDEVEQSIPDRFEQIAAEHAGRLAVKNSRAELTYDELNRAANRVAHALLARRGSAEEPVLLLLDNGAPMIASMIGALKAAKIYVPLDPSFPILRNREILEDTLAGLIVTDSRNFSLAAELAADKLVAINIDELDRSPSDDNPRPRAAPDTPAYILYTSGSTGKPKGVLQNHRNVLHLIMRHTHRARIRPDDRIALLRSFGVHGGTLDTFAALLNGAAILPFDIKRQGMRELAKWLAREEITLCRIGPTPFRHLAQALGEADRFPRLRMLAFSGEPLHKNDVELCRRHFSPDCILVNSFGATEVSSCCEYIIDGTTRIEDGTVPCGAPAQDMKIYLLDDDGKESRPGETGEIAVKSRYLALGYWNRPELTRANFLPDPEGSEERVYLTGDLGRMLPDGRLLHLGRKDFQFKIRGYRVEAGEVEAALLSLDNVKEALAVARDADENPKSKIQNPKSAGKRLIAYLVPRKAPPPTVTALRRALAEKLPDYMIPSTFVVLDALPLTPNGKVDRRALPEPSGSRPELESPPVAPRSPTEKTTAEIWAAALVLDQVGIHDNFFDLGGDSLLATQVVSQACKVFQIDLPLSRLFEAPTVAALAEQIEAALRTDRDRSGPALRPFPRDTKPPLSFAQQRLWFLDQLEPGNPAYNIPAVLRLSGRLDPAALEQSLCEIVRRHETLRTTFSTADGRPFQAIAPAPALSLPAIDLQELPENRRDAEAQRIIAEETRRRFDLAQGPLIRAQLLRLGREEHILLLTMHHIVSDGWSRGVLLRELSALYNAFSCGKPTALPELPVQYADFALWQRQWLNGETLEEQVAYWKKQLAALPALQFPTDRPRSPAQTYRGASRSLALSQPLTEALRKLSAREGATLFMTLLAAFKTLLYCYTGQDDIAVGCPIAGRTRPEIEGMIGFFVNTLVLRTDLSGNPSFRGLLAREREACVGAYAHQELPFEKLVEELQPERDLSRTPLFQVFFNMMTSGGRGTLDLPGLKGEWLEVPEAASKFDMTLYARERDGALVFSLAYNPDLFESATIGRLLGHYHTLLEAIAADPERPISSLSLMTEAERTQLAARRNRVAPANPFIEFKKADAEQSLHARFEQIAERYAERSAVRTGNCEWTYGELNRRANRIARAVLRSCGRGEERAALFFDHDAPMIAALLGALKAGKTYVPLDPAYPAERLRYLLEDSEAGAMITDNRNISAAAALTQGSRRLINIDDAGYEATGNPGLAVSPDALAYILYTSGSTGEPKGVMQSQRNVLHHIRSYANSLRITPDDKLTLFSSYGFDAAVMDIFGALLNGAALLPADIKEETRERLLARMIEAGATIFHSTPTVYRYLFGSLTGKEDLSALRLVVLGGEEVHKEDVDLFQRRFSSKAIFVNGLGPTESTLALQYFIDCKTELAGSAVPVGYPVEETEILLLDDAGRETEIYGEIAIRSARVALGYWRKPEMTGAVFLPDPTDRSKRLYRTGDLGRLLPDGSIAFAGRRGFQVKIRGFRIELGEIEATLCQHAAVAEAVVVAREDTPGEQRLVAYVTPNTEQAVITGDLRNFLKTKLPEYMVPSIFVALDVLPLTPNRKVDRFALPAPDRGRPEAENSFVAPRSTIEETLANIWAQLLGLERVGAHDNFFDLGGHSLLATQVISRVRELYRIEISLRNFFETPTVAGIAEVIERAKDSGAEIPMPQISRVPRRMKPPL
jgi:amino acid adenylation domain-containing protein